MELDGLIFTTSMSGINDVELTSELKGSYDEVTLAGEVCEDKLRKALHEEVDGKHTCLWSDCDPDEPSERRYYAFGNKTIKPANNLGGLIYFLNRPNYDLYMVELEQYQ